MMDSTRAALRALALGLLLALVAAPLLAEGGPGGAEATATQGPREAFGVAAHLDWAGRSLALRVDLDLGLLGIKLPSGRPEAERLLTAALPAILKDLVLELPVDARRSFADCLADGTIPESALTDLAARLEAGPATFSRDFRRFGADYRLPLEALEGLLVQHRSALLPAAPMEWRPTKAYTGIVIYAQAPLPVRGERTTASLRPCLFPRLYDEAMNLLLDRNTLSPAALADWGEVAYASALGPETLARVGEAPLRIEATALFGQRRSDLLIPRDEALKILGLPENRNLLAQGRVVIIVVPAALSQPLSGAPGSAAAAHD